MKNRVAFVAFATLALGLHGCHWASPLEPNDSFSAQSYIDGDGDLLVLFKEKEQIVLELRVVSDGTETITVYSQGRVIASGGYMNGNNGEGLVVAVGDEFPPVTVVSMDRDNDGTTDYRKIGIPSNGVFRNEYYDLDLDGVFDAWVDRENETMKILEQNSWQETVFDEKVLLQSAPYLEIDNGRKLRSVVFENGSWREYENR